ncbi:polymorphic toxin-type HINT domain-containing protein [Kitasatospora sp. NPDC088391]|uniref:polymorphic toxin-type HINT domain-containing protein n=1 Tax=Kitasatospora sp. NPDC088391 TaxID=3364074 RepID=UPI0038307B73
MVDLTVQTQEGNTETVHTTSKHTFWDDTTRTWVPAGELTPGHDLVTAGGSHVRVVEHRSVAGEADMYNLTVAQLHTYYVLAGSTPVLVHNCGGSVTTPRPHSKKCDCANGANPRIPPNPYGSRGKPSTVAQLAELRDEILDANPDWIHAHGGVDRTTGLDLPEERIYNPNNKSEWWQTE